MSSNRSTNGWGKLGLKILMGSTLGITVLQTLTFSTNCALAQSNIVPDTTLGTENSTVIPNFNGLPIEVIDGGAIRGQNLFHSFREFNVNEGRGAYFFSPNADIQNILARVTGNNRSEILGTLGTFGNSNPNLFLINPNGIVFGRNARLDVGSSFVATTANAIGFGDRGFFSATNPNTPTLLTVNPSAFLFNQITNASIQNNSRAPAVNPSVFGLGVPNGRSLLLIGGNVNINSAGLYALGGQVELGGLAGSGTVGLLLNNNDLSLSFPEGVARADVSLIGDGGVSVAAQRGGNILAYGRNIDVLGGSVLTAGIGGGLGAVDNKAGDIILNATGTITIAGRGSLVQNLVQTGATGNSGNIRLAAESLAISDSAALIVQLSERGRGNLGNVIINVRDQVSLNEGAVFSSVSKGGVGKSGNITVTTGSLSLSNGGTLDVSNSGQGDAGSVLIQARSSISADGVGRSGSPLSNIPSGIGSLVGPGVIGEGGDINIVAESFSLTNGAEIATSLNGYGRAGNVTIQTRGSVLIDGVGSNGFSSGIFSTLNPLGVGEGGNVTVIADSLSLTNGGELATSVFGQGRAGNVTIQTRGSVLIDGVGSNELPSGAFSTLVQSSGRGGNVTVIADSLSLSNGGGLSSNTIGQGNAGEVKIEVQKAISLDGFGSAITNGVGPNAIGGGGDINISTGSLLLTRGAQINTATAGRGNAGNVTIEAREAVTLDGVGTNFSASGVATSVAPTGIGKGGSLKVSTSLLFVTNGALITAETEGNGDAGSITVLADTIEVVNGSQLRTSTGSDRQAGDITLRVQDRLTLKGRNSGLFANTETGSTGNGGNIFIQPRNVSALKTLVIQDNARIAVNSQGSGIGGNIQIQAKDLALDNQGLISAETAGNQGGDITLNLQNLLSLRNGSQISTTAGTAQAGGDGGNISINAPFIVAVPKEDSDITANAFRGRGGFINIKANGVFGITRREQLTRLSDITAFSQQNSELNGVVQINRPEVDPTQGLVELPVNLVDASQQIATGCNPGGKQRRGSFTATGRGGVAPSPTEPLIGDAVLAEWVTLPSEIGRLGDGKLGHLGENTTPNYPTQIVEASGWFVDNNGDVILVATTPIATYHNPWLRGASCSDLQVKVR